MVPCLVAPVRAVRRVVASITTGGRFQDVCVGRVNWFHRSNKCFVTVSCVPETRLHGGGRSRMTRRLCEASKLTFVSETVALFI